MIDARHWRRPTPEQVRAMLPPGMTRAEIAARIDVSERAIRYWITKEAPEGKRIAFKEWLALKALAEGER